MLCNFRAMGPNAFRIVVVGDSNLKDGQSPSLEDMHLDSQVLSAIHQAISFEVFKEISTCKSAHVAWTKLEDIYGGSNLDEENILFGELMEEFSKFLHHEELSITSTSNYLDTSISSTSPTCGVPQGNDMVSEEISCNDGVKLICDDMLDLPCCHDRNVLVSSSYSMTNHVEEIKKDEACLIDEEPSSPKESSSTPLFTCASWQEVMTRYHLLLVIMMIVVMRMRMMT